MIAFSVVRMDRPIRGMLNTSRGQQLLQEGDELEKLSKNIDRYWDAYNTLFYKFLRSNGSVFLKREGERGSEDITELIKSLEDEYARRSKQLVLDQQEYLAYLRGKQVQQTT